MAEISNNNAGTLIAGTNENDLIFGNYYDNVTVRGGTGDDTISGADVIQYAEGDGNDFVEGNFLYNGKVQLLSETVDSIVMNGSSEILKVGNGSITFTNLDQLLKVKLVNAAGVEINNSIPIYGTEDNDTIKNIYYEIDNICFDGLNGNDYIQTSGKNVTLVGGIGDDTLFSGGDNTLIIGGTGNDSLVSNGTRSTLNGGIGDDTIYGNDAYNLIDGGDGNDSIKGSGDYSTINGGTGNDTIYHIGGASFVYGGDGDDSIYNSGDNDTINAGSGNDTIAFTWSSYYNLVIYNEGDGNDVIENFSDNSTLQVNSGTIDSFMLGTSDLTINIGTGNITFKNIRNNIDTLNDLNIVDAAGNSLSLGSIVSGTDNDDFIDNYYHHDQVLDHISINGGIGNDEIMSNGEDVTIRGGKGNDTIYTGRGHYSIEDDDIYIDARSLIQYAEGDGDDILVVGAKNQSTLQILSGELIGVFDGDDMYFKVGSNTIKFLEPYSYESITLIDSEGKPIDYSATILNTDNYFFSNETSNLTINGSTDNDKIINSGNHVIIYGDAGDDYFINTASDVTIIDTIGNNQFYIHTSQNNTANNVMIISGEGKDTIDIDDVHFTTIISGSGDDFIDNYNSPNSSIIAGEGNNTIWARNSYKGLGSPHTTITAANGNNIIKSEDNYVNIITGDGSNSIKTGEYSNITTGNGSNYISAGIYSKVAAGNGNNSISVGKYSKVTTGTGDDTIIDGSRVYAGDGNDIISCTVESSKVYAGGGNDTIKFSNSYDNFINGSTGNDLIIINDDVNNLNNISYVKWLANSIMASKIEKGITDIKSIISAVNVDSIKAAYDVQLNEIYLSSMAEILIYKYEEQERTGQIEITPPIGREAGQQIYSYAEGDGFDTITGYSEKDSIYITGGTYSTQSSGNDTIIKVGSGSIKLVDVKDKQINIINGPAPSVISANDTVANIPKEFEGIFSDDYYDDSVIKIDASKVKNSISIIGNTNDNYITGSHYDDTISGGAGNDYLYGGIGKDVFVYSGGNDTIADYTNNLDYNRKKSSVESDIIKLDNAKIIGSTIINPGNRKNTLVLYTDKGNINILNGYDREITIIDTEGNETTGIYGYNAPQETLIYNKNKTEVTLPASFSGTFDTLSCYEYVRKIDASLVNAPTTIISGSHIGTIIGGNGNDYIESYMSKASINGGSGNDTIIGGKNINGGEGKDTFVYQTGENLKTIYDYNEGEDVIKIESGKIVNSVVDGRDVYLLLEGASITSSEVTEIIHATGIDSMGNPIFGYYDDSGEPVYSYTPNGDYSETMTTEYTTENNEGDIIRVKNAKDKKITIIDSNNKTSSKVYTTTAGYVIENVIEGTESITSTIYGGSAATTVKGGDSSTSTVKGGDSSTSTIEGGDSSTSTVKGGDSSTSSVKGGDSSTSTVKGGNTSTTLTLNDKDKKSPAINNNIINIDASKRSAVVNITGNSKNNSIIGGKGADTLNGGKGNDTLKGGNGSDIFTYKNGEGNDIITDYSTADKIKILSGSIKSSSLSGSDVVLKIGNGSIKIKKGVKKGINIIDSKGKTTTLIYGNNTKAKLTGSTGADSIVGGNGNDTLNGSKGNDTLTGGKGNDIFVYAKGDGNDVITDYTAGKDKIKITGAKISKTSVSGSDVILKVGSGSIKIKNGKGKSLSIYNNSSSAVSTVIGSKGYEERWFLEDDNLVASEIDSILNKDSKLISINFENNITSELITNPIEENLLISNNYNQSNKKTYSSK